MAKRRLSKNQARRIRSNQEASVAKAKDDAPAENEHELGPEQFGRVVAHFGSQVEVEVDNASTVRCFLRANIDTIVTGDTVVWRRQAEKGVVVSVEDRKSLLSRPDSFGKLKPVAANVDQIIITVAPKPQLFTNLIDRYIVIAEINNIRPILLVNKSDLIGDTNYSEFESIKSIYSALGYEVTFTSAKQDNALSSLKDILLNKTSIFVGQSGVGKSSIIQRLMPNENILVGGLSDSKSKGKHTTTHSQLFRFADGGDCIDSPGIREFGLWHLSEEQVIEGFVELKALAGKCKFRDCKHQNEPSCALQIALQEDKITRERFDSYKRIVASLGDVEVKAPKT